MSTKVWTLPKHKLHLQNCSRAYASKYSHWLPPMVYILFSVMEQKMQMDDACTCTCIFEHISSCSIAHNSMNHQSTNMFNRYIYMTAVNIHRSNLRKTSVLKLFQDKNQLLIKTQTVVIVPTYSLTNLKKFLNTAFFLELQGCAF